jgi:Zn-dependent M28 family amino/carboxypeptidase
VSDIPSRPPPVDTQALEAHVRTLSENYHPRSHENRTKLDAAADYVHAQLAKSGAKVIEQVYQADDIKARNISVNFGPATGERLVIGAHYDSHYHTPGADDNASGVAGLIELARLLAKAELKRPVELVAYTLEEPPYFRTDEMGSAQHARALKARDVPVRLMVSIEMIGYYSDEDNSQTYPLAALKAIYPTRGDFIGVVGRFDDMSDVRRVKAAMRGASSLPVVSMNAPALLKGVDFSDHLNYWAEGYPALLITDTSFFRNHHYHELTDVSSTLDFPRMAQAVQGIYAAIVAVANSD